MEFISALSARSPTLATLVQTQINKQLCRVILASSKILIFKKIRNRKRTLSYIMKLCPPCFFPSPTHMLMYVHNGLCSLTSRYFSLFILRHTPPPAVVALGSLKLQATATSRCTVPCSCPGHSGCFQLAPCIMLQRSIVCTAPNFNLH